MSMEDFEQKQDDRDMRDYIGHAAVIIVAALIIVVFRGRWGSFTWDSATTWGVLIIIGWWLALSTLQMFYNMSPKIVYNYGHNTTYGEIYSCGSYMLIRPGVMTSESLGMFWRRPGAFVFPMDAWEKSGPNIVIKARMEKVDFAELPLYARSIIEKTSIPPPYWLGFADEEQYGDIIEDPEAVDPDKKKISVSHLITQVKELNKENTFYRNIMDRYMTSMEGLKEWADRIARKDSIYDRVMDALKSGQDSSGQQ